jgi:choline dehydrogenase
MKYKSLSKTLGFFVGIIGLLSGHDLHAKVKHLTADIIVIGGGTAGCALTSKLSKKYKVILLDAGTNQSNNPQISLAANNGGLVNNVNYFFWELGHWVDTHTPTGAPIFLPAVAGKVLGGGSAVNGLQFVRSTAGYFSGVEAITGDSDWGPTNAFTVYNDIETFNGVSGQYNPAAHGFTGPLNVRQCVLNPLAATSFANSTATVTGVPVISDYNNPSTPNGPFVNWQITENPNETRAHSFLAYLQDKVKLKSDNVYKGKNIILYTMARVEQILFSDDQIPVAKGVRAVVDGEEFIFQAKEKIIVAAGFQSPVLLQLSGIGPKAVLKAAGIDVVVDSPNVGQKMVNHPIFTLTGVGVVPVDPNPNPNNLYTGGAFLPDPSQPGNLGRSFQWIGIAGAGNFTIAALLLDAKSQGTIGVFGSNPIRMPNIQFNYWTNPDDIASALACYGQMYLTLQDMGLTPLGPDPVSPANVQAYILSTYNEAYHWTGSCSMGTSISTAVVDSSGHVFGTKNLVVADITISPLNCLGNTQGIAYLIGNIIANKILND